MEMEIELEFKPGKIFLPEHKKLRLYIEKKAKRLIRDKNIKAGATFLFKNKSVLIYEPDRNLRGDFKLCSDKGFDPIGLMKEET